MTVGTGIGGGVVLNSDILSGSAHPEMGHIMVKRHPEDDYEGTCPFHKDCLEGLAAGPSIEARTGIKGQNLPEDHPVWDIQSILSCPSISQLYIDISTRKNHLGGGVMNQAHLLQKVREQFTTLMASYMETPPVEGSILFNGACQMRVGLSELAFSGKAHREGNEFA